MYYRVIAGIAHLITPSFLDSLYHKYIILSNSHLLRPFQTAKPVRTMWGRHGSRIVVSGAHTFASDTPCFVPLTKINSHSGCFLFVNYQLRNAQSVCRWILIVMSRASLIEKQKEKDRTLCDLFLFGSPDRA